MPLLRILVVEDHAPFRHPICSALQTTTDFQTIEAGGWVWLQFPRGLLNSLLDLILLNINLPKLHGFVLAGGACVRG
jgi:DNA-binding response OmpR family regulator